MKSGVKHRFKTTDPYIKNFVTNVFENWENDTFQAFELIKNPAGIAIDIGAWIGTTSIWLSKNFSTVVAVEADKTSVEDLAINLKLSDSTNVKICNQPIHSDRQTVLFGPRNVNSWNRLNMSTSYMKPNSTSDDDYSTMSVTLEDVVSLTDEHKTDANKRVSFIKCDIEGGEEHIVCDILDYARQNQVNCLLSFHIPWWSDQSRIVKITPFLRDFDCYSIDVSIPDVLNFLEKDPWGNILFRPKNRAV